MSEPCSRESRTLRSDYYKTAKKSAFPRGDAANSPSTSSLSRVRAQAAACDVGHEVIPHGKSSRSLQRSGNSDAIRVFAMSRRLAARCGHDEYAAPIDPGQHDEG